MPIFTLFNLYSSASFPLPSTDALYQFLLNLKIRSRRLQCDECSSPYSAILLPNNLINKDSLNSTSNKEQ